MKKKMDMKQSRQQKWQEKPDFGSLYNPPETKHIYISLNYFKQRMRFPTDRENTPENWNELVKFMNKVGEKIQKRTFCFAESFYWLNQETKDHFSLLEGRELHPEPEHVIFGDYVKTWMKKTIPSFASVSKQRDYEDNLTSRIIPYFKNMSFAQITASAVASFVDSMKRCNRSKSLVKKISKDGKSAKPLSTKRLQNILNPLRRVWMSACEDNNWTLRDPFSNIGDKLSALEDKALQKREQNIILNGGIDPDNESNRRDIMLLNEWLRLRKCVDPHYYLVLELLLMGMIGSELEGLLKVNITEDFIQARCAVVKDKKGKRHMKFKLKNWYRKRDLPLTARLRGLIELTMSVSNSSDMRIFENGISLPASNFVLTMKDGSPFNYDSFRKTVWDKAMIQSEIQFRVPYSSRHTFVQWASMVGVSKNRLVDLMGHNSKKMVDEVYGKYRQGLVDEKEQIIDYLGEDFLALEELRTAFPERYWQKMESRKQDVSESLQTEKTKALDLSATFCQSFGHSRGLYADNYRK